jgi:hypothetical protein
MVVGLSLSLLHARVSTKIRGLTLSDRFLRAYDSDPLVRHSVERHHLVLFQEVESTQMVSEAKQKWGDNTHCICIFVR